MFAKINVNGGSASPLWTFLKEKQAGFLINAIKWNFTKFLINREGVPVARFGQDLMLISQNYIFRFGPNDSVVPTVEAEVQKLL